MTIAPSADLGVRERTPLWRTRSTWLLLDRLLTSIVRTGRLEIIDADGSPHVYAGAPGAAVGIRLHDPALHRRLVLQPSTAMAEAYVRGDLTVERGTLYDLVDLYAQNVGVWDEHPWRRFRSFLEATAEKLGGATSVRSARRNVEHHYELPEAFYRLFLDADLQYSCAYFRRERDGLDEAQQNKKEHVAAKLRLERGLDVLDIGSGWGGLSLYLAARFGVRVVGITLSREQLDVSRRRAREAGLSERVRFELCDFREATGKFDRIVSVGMFEHVGAAAYDTFFERVDSLLRDHGVAVLHSIGRMEPPRTQDGWIRKYIFPGAHIPALSEVFPAVERSGLWCTDVEVLRLHYARTIRHWRSRFRANREDVRRRFGEPFCRRWELYLAAAEVSFRRMREMVFQMQLTRRIDAVPLTRDYMVAEERRSRELEGAVQAKQSEDHERLSGDSDEPHLSAVGPDPFV